MYLWYLVNVSDIYVLHIHDTYIYLVLLVATHPEEMLTKGAILPVTVFAILGM